MELNHNKDKIQRKDKCNKKVFEISDHKLEISKTNRGKNQIILDKKYKYNFLYKKKDNTKDNKLLLFILIIFAELII